MLNHSFFLIKSPYKIILILILILIWNCLFINHLVYADSVSKFDKVLDSLLNKDYQSAKEIFNGELQAHKAHVPENLRSLLNEPFFLADEIYGNVLTTQEELDYIRSAVISKRLVKRLTDGLKTDRDIIFTLYDWAVRNIAILSANDIGPDINGFIYDNMMRGFGVCDRSAWVLATLAYQAGYHANVISMPDHAIAQIYLEDTWALLDPHYGIIFKDDKKLLGLDDKAAIESIIKANRCYGKRAVEYFMSSNIVTICEPLSISPKMEILQNVLNKHYEDPPRVYYDILGELSFSISTMSGSSATKLESPITVPYAFPGKKYTIMVWLFPFEIRFSSKRVTYIANMEKHYPHLKYYAKAREYQIMGDFEKALAEYGKLLSATLNSSAKESLVYNKALCYYEMKEYVSAKKLFLSYKENYPQGKEIKGVVYHLELMNGIKSINDVNKRVYSKGRSFDPDYHYRLKKSIAIDTNNSYSQAMLFSGFRNRASDYHNSGQPDKAIDALEKAIAIKPYYNMYQELGNAYFRNGELDKAENVYLKVIESKPDYIDPYSSLAVIHIKNGKYDKAIIELKKTLKFDPNLNDNRYNLGVAYFMKGDVEIAQSELLKVLKLEDDYAQAHYVLSLVYYNDSNYGKFVYHCDKALVLGVKIPSETLERLKYYKEEALLNNQKNQVSTK
ncbi:MAG: tetratricopeptide repeat protein [Candidatus Anammoxibacter sp.]